MKKILLLSSILVLVSLFMSDFPGAQQNTETSYASPSSCQKCHEREYLSWLSSMHSKSVSSKNLIFAKTFEMAIEETKGATRERCLSCHSPIAVALGDLNLKKSISKEGISCDYCHTLKGEKTESGTMKIVSSPGEIKYGPYSEAASEAHKTEFSELHTKSELCLKCHTTVRNNAGVEICTTEAEYRGSVYDKKNVPCQLCHMPPIPGKAASNANEREKVFVHGFSGGHAKEFLSQAAIVQLKVEETEEGRKLTVSVQNLNGGHYLPTGSTLREIFLKLFAYDSSGKELWTNWTKNPASEDNQAFFAKVVTDDEGNRALPWKATKVASDTRLTVRENRKLTYILPKDLPVEKITANLQYKLAPNELLDALQIEEAALRNVHTMARAELVLKKGEGTEAPPEVQKTVERSMMRTIRVYAESWAFTPSEIKIKQGERVKLILSTLDDTHGFRVKDMGINVKIFPNKPVEVEIEGKEKGEYKFDCPVPCGDRCFKMKGVIIVE